MKTKVNIWFLVLCIAAISFNSCRDDKTDYKDVSEREFMTMFRHYDNYRNDSRLSAVDVISTAHLSPPYGCGNLDLEGRPNSIYLVWYGVQDCAGYHIRIKSSLTGPGEASSTRWTKNDAILDTIIYEPETVSIEIPNLQYRFTHDCAIRVLSKRGLPPTKDVLYTPAYENDPYHSLWYGYGGGQHRLNYCRIMTAARPGVPNTVVKYGERGDDGTWVEIKFNLDATAWLPGGAANPNGDNLNPLIEIDYSHTPPLFKADYIELVPQVVSSTQTRSSSTPETKRKYFKDITINPNGTGSVIFDDMVKNVMYMINVVNDNPNMIKWDRFYNTEMVRMKGDPLDPILIEHKLYTADPNPELNPNDQKAFEQLSKKHNACRIDQLLSSYMDDNDYPEDTEFLLESGKTYFINSGVEISKGVRLRCDDPNNPATVLMGVGYLGVGSAILVDYEKSKLTGQGVRAYNFSFGRNPRAGEMGSINISEIVFENIIFKVIDSYNFDNIDFVPGASTGLPNYFINQSASAMNFSCDKFEVRNCTFQGFHRGFIRTQGTNAQRFKEFTLDGILVYNCGGYDDTGRGYPMIAGANNNKDACLFANMTVKNSTFVNSPFDSFFSETGNLSWPEGDVWNVTLENCTFLNFSTRSESNNQRVLFRLQYPPAYSKFTIKNNLFIICPAKGEAPDNYHSAGIHITRHPEGFKWDIDNNYSTNVFPGTATSIFRHRAFNSATESAGVDGGYYNIGGLPALEIRLGSPSLAPEELMIDPYPLGPLRSKLGHKNNIDGLYYQNTEKVRNHDIVKNNIGDPRWKKNL